MTTNPLPPGWEEIFNCPSRMDDLEEAIAILADSFTPGQYPQSMHNMIRTMIPRKVNGHYIMNLRVFIRKPNICAFFFLRHIYPPTRYSLSPGALQSVSDDDVYDQLVAIGAYMNREVNNPGLEIVSETNSPAFKYSNLANAFAKALSPPAGGPPPRLTYAGKMTAGEPWPPSLFRWDVVNLP